MPKVKVHPNIINLNALLSALDLPLSALILGVPRCGQEMEGHMLESFILLIALECH